MRRLTEILSKPMISLYEGKSEGTIKNAIFSKDLKAVKWIVLFDDKDMLEQKYLSVKDIFSIGENAVVIKNSESIVPNIIEADTNENNPINCAIYTVSGDLIDIVSDVLLDDKLCTLNLELKNKTQLSPSKLIITGQDALILQDEANPVNVSSLKQKSFPKPKKENMSMQKVKIMSVEQNTSQDDEKNAKALEENKEEVKEELKAKEEVEVKEESAVSEKIINEAPVAVEEPVKKQEPAVVEQPVKKQEPAVVEEPVKKQESVAVEEPVKKQTPKKASTTTAKKQSSAKKPQTTSAKTQKPKSSTSQKPKEVVKKQTNAKTQTAPPTIAPKKEIKKTKPTEKQKELSEKNKIAAIDAELEKTEQKLNIAKEQLKEKKETLTKEVNSFKKQIQKIIKPKIKEPTTEIQEHQKPVRKIVPPPFSETTARPNRMLLNAEFLLSRVTTKMVQTYQGEVIAKSGEKITNEIIEFAFIAGKLPELIKYSK